MAIVIEQSGYKDIVEWYKLRRAQQLIQPDRHQLACHHRLVGFS